jgi:hypothetical protein
MDMQHQVITQLEQLAAKGPQAIEAVVQPSSTPGVIVGLPAEGYGLSLNLADYDRYSVILRHLEICDNHFVVGDSNTKDFLRQAATTITQRITYLEEPLTLIELDAHNGVAQLRSAPPISTATEIIYWELNLWRAPHPRVRLARYRWTAKDYERTPLNHPLTFVAIGRLAQDLAASLAAITTE